MHFVLLLFCWQLTVAAPELAPALLGLSAAFWLLVVPLWLRFKWTLAGNDAFGYLLGALVILPTWAAMVALHAVSVWLLLAVMALVWVADIAAYFSGRAFGKHKLAPSISPGKTWEGVAGAVVGVFIYGGVVLGFSPLAGKLPLPMPVIVLVLALLLTAVSVMGDLFESLLKRQAGIKDSSGLLPGHGGVLDRIDALTSALPLAALILYWYAHETCHPGRHGFDRVPAHSTWWRVIRIASRSWPSPGTARSRFSPPNAVSFVRPTQWWVVLPRPPALPHCCAMRVCALRCFTAPRPWSRLRRCPKSMR
jgi:CDP-diglyceride synthetase